MYNYYENKYEYQNKSRSEIFCEPLVKMIAFSCEKSKNTGRRTDHRDLFTNIPQWHLEF